MVRDNKREQVMGFAYRNSSSEEGCELEPSRGGTTLQTFNGIRAIRVHLNQCAGLKDYLCGRTKRIPDVPMSCHSECTLAQWLHAENGDTCINRQLIDAACKCCQEFQEMAAQLVLLTRIGKPEPVLSVVQSFVRFDGASSCFQAALAELHVECRYNQ